MFGDCDMAKAIDALAYGAFLYTGQSCTAATRIIVQRDSYDAFAEAFVARARSLPVGNPLDEGTLVGPLVSAWVRGIECVVKTRAAPSRASTGSSSSAAAVASTNGSTNPGWSK